MDTPQAFANTDPPTNTDIGASLDRDSPIVVVDATTRQRWPVWAELDRSVDLAGHPPPPGQTALIIARRGTSPRATATSSPFGV
jgi:hypothetical protein